MMSNLLAVYLLLNIFNIDLVDSKLSDYNNTIFVVLNGIYCFECMKETNIALKEVDSNYKIIILIDSKKDEQYVWARYRYLKKIYQFNNVLFFNSGEKEMIYELNGYDISRTPIILIKKNNILNYLDYDTLFMHGYNSKSIKKQVCNIINSN